MSFQSLKKSRFKDADVRIQEIQNAARKMFFKKGFRNTSMEEIAKKARVSKGTVYLYFKNKEEVYISLMMPVLEEIGRNLDKLESRLMEQKYFSCEEVVAGYLKAHLHAYEYDPDGLRIVQAFVQGDYTSAMSKETLEKINKRGHTNYETSRRIFSNSIKLGVTKNLKVAPLVDFMWGAFIGIIEVEESKLRQTKKDHVFDTLEYAFSIISDGICSS